MAGVSKVEITIIKPNFPEHPITSPTALEEVLRYFTYTARINAIEFEVAYHKLRGHAPLNTKYRELWLASRALVIDKMPKATSYYQESEIRHRIKLTATEKAIIQRFNQSVSVIQEKSGKPGLTDNMRAIREMKQVVENELRKPHPSVMQIKSVAEYLEVLSLYTTFTTLERIEVEGVHDMINSMIEGE